MSVETAATVELNLSNSPYVSENNVPMQKREQGVIRPWQYLPKEVGGINADDLKSVGDAPNDKTILLAMKRTKLPHKTIN